MYIIILIVLKIVILTKFLLQNLIKSNKVYK